MKNISESFYQLLTRHGVGQKSIGARGFLKAYITRKYALRTAQECRTTFPCRSSKYNAVMPTLRGIKQVSGLRGEEALKFALAARKAQMLESYLYAVKQAVVSCKLLPEVELEILLQQLKSAFILSQDADLLNCAIASFPKDKFELTVPGKILTHLEPIFQAVVKKDNSANAQVYDHFDDELWLSEHAEFNGLNQLQQLGLAVNSACFEGDYVNSLNALLSYFELSGLEEAKPCLNALSSFRFSSVPSCDGDLVTVIMSCYNAEDTVDYAVKSLLSQSYKQLEILICDDCSTDSSLEKLKLLAKSDPRISLYQSSSNQGTYNIRNMLIAKAQGRYVTFHDADDLAHPMRIAQQVNHLVSNQLLVSSCRWIRVSSTGILNFFFDGQMLKFCVVSTMVDKAVFALIPAFRSTLVGADTEFYENCQFYLGENYIGILEKPLIFGLWADNSLTRQPGLNAENSGFVSEKRRVYSENAAKQRVYGVETISDAQIDDALKSANLYRQQYPIVRV